MDELEWLKANSPSTQPSRDITRRHRTQLRGAIASEGADGTQPRRPRRDRRSRHRVLVTTTVVVALCAVGAGIVALASAGGDGGEHDTAEVGAPVASGPSSTAPAKACTGSPPAPLAIPDGFGNATAAPAALALVPPTTSQQVTSWSSDDTTIEQRWPPDAGVVEQFGSPSAPAEGSVIAAEAVSKIDDTGAARRTLVITFAGKADGCANLQVTVSGRNPGTVDGIVNGLIAAPFRSSQPLVSTTGAAASVPPVVACDGVARGVRDAVATVGGPVSQAAFARPTEALTEFLAHRPQLPQRGFQELSLDDSSIAYVAEIRPGVVVTTVRVVSTKTGWTAVGWEASGC